MAGVAGILAAGLLMVLAVMPAHAVQPDEILSNPALEARARALSAGLRCLVCQNETIDESNAPLARDLRLLVRERLTKGDSDEEVIAFVVDRYGEFVLLRPRFGPHTYLLWLGPLLLLGAGGYLAWHALRRSRPETAAAEALSRSEQARLKKLMEQ